tara:strand:+ start:1109 stop:1975 length:867 start_codon:yes stop_codon:yes gene_type:complete
MIFNRIALGAAQFGMRYGISNTDGQTSLNEVKKIVDLAKKLNIDMIDSAISYGSSEENLGEIGIDNFKIVSKLPSGVLVKAKPSISRYITESLERLRKDYLYGFLCHNANDLLSPGGEIIYKGLRNAKDSGLIKKIGVSVYHPEEIRQLMYYYDLDIIQAPFNIIDNRLLTSGVLNEICNSSIELHVRSIFLQGLLLMTPSLIKKRFNEWDELWTNWEVWLKDSKISPLEACFSYALSFREIDKIIIGVESEWQLNEIANITLIKNMNIPSKLHNDNQMLINPANWNK